MDSEISRLSEEQAIAILARFPEVRQASVPPVSSLPRTELQALSEHFGGPLVSARVSEGELARQALLLLADSPDRREIIYTMARNMPAPAQRFDAGLSLAVGTAAFLVLQTHVHAKRDKNGKWTIEIKKQPTDMTALKLLVEKLLPFLSDK